jgi:hypothetical protein
LSVKGMDVTGQREVQGHTEATESSATGQPDNGIGDRRGRTCPLDPTFEREPPGLGNYWGCQRSARGDW